MKERVCWDGAETKKRVGESYSTHIPSYLFYLSRSRCQEERGVATQITAIPFVYINAPLLV